jgi:hypothetical protein
MSPELNVAVCDNFGVRGEHRVVVAAVAILVGLASSSSGSPSTQAASACKAASVHYTPSPGATGVLKTLPWVGGMPSRLGLVGLLWYWPEDWRAQRLGRARIFTGGEAPGGYSTKVMWVFTSNAAKRTAAGRLLIVKGNRLDGPGKSWQRFAAISYAGQNGAPSYASIIKLPAAGCWRLDLSAGALRATLTIEAVSPE